MAVALHGTRSLRVEAGTTATVTFIAPSIVTAGDVWICAATMRGGTGNTFSAVPGTFTQVSRVDNGTVDTLIAWRYTAAGSETAGASFATVTVSTARISVTSVAAFSGANAAGILTETGTASASSVTMPDTNDNTSGASDAVVLVGSVPASSATTITYSANLTALVASGGNGGSGATVITFGSGYALGAFTSGTTFSETFGTAGAGCAVAITIPATTVAAKAPPPSPPYLERVYLLVR